MIKGSITLLDRAGTQITVDIEGANPREFHVNKIKMQKLLGQFGHTPVDIPSGGIVLPWGNHDTFDWNSIGATPSKMRVRDQETGEMKELDVVYYRGDSYTRRDWIGMKVKGNLMPDAITYSRGARKTAEDEEKATGSTGNVGGGGYITLISFKKFKNMAPDYRYPEYDKEDGETAVAPRQQSQRQAAPQAKGTRSYLQLKNLLTEKLEKLGKDSSEEAVVKNILARAKKGLGVTVDSPFKLSPKQNYEIYTSFGGSPDEITESAGSNKNSGNRAKPVDSNEPVRSAAKAPVTHKGKADITEDIQSKANVAPKKKAAPAPDPAPVKKKKAPPVIEEIEYDDEPEDDMPEDNYVDTDPAHDISENGDDDFSDMVDDIANADDPIEEDDDDFDDEIEDDEMDQEEDDDDDDLLV